jgi:hypothetical protein
VNEVVTPLITREYWPNTWIVLFPVDEYYYATPVIMHGVPIPDIYTGALIEIIWPLIEQNSRVALKVPGRDLLKSMDTKKLVVETAEVTKLLVVGQDAAKY